MTRQESQEVNAAIEEARAGLVSPNATVLAAITYYITFGSDDPTCVMIHRLASEELPLPTRRKLWLIHHKYGRRAK
ncbi:MAG: hypothetical protein K6G94_01825 [Kiritimatiellae bacterium]|nr:hypothetical protein [Kiritimatiellia bacterium]